MNYCNGDQIAFCTRRGKIYIWDSYLSTALDTNKKASKSKDDILVPYKTIELSDLSFKMLSFHIVGFDYNRHKMLLTTISGDVVEISMKEKKRIRAK